MVQFHFGPLIELFKKGNNMNKEQLIKSMIRHRRLILGHGYYDFDKELKIKKLKLFSFIVLIGIIVYLI